MSVQNEASQHPRAILSRLIAQRRSMQHDELDHGLREANRLAIVYWQRQLSQDVAPESDAAVVRN